MRVSVVVPTFNAGPGFEELLRLLCAQVGDFESEVLVVDSGSTDGTVELARRYGAAVRGIEKSTFNHGATRNLGISLTGGEYVALIVQDALPLDGRWLAAMVENLEGDERVAGVYGRQVPRPESSALARAVVDNLHTALPERREQFADSPEGYRRIPPAQRRSLATFDNVSSCLRRSIWELAPFQETDFGEDLRWGERVVSLGYKLVYEPRSAVFHSHERGLAYDLRRNYVGQLVVSDLFGFEPVPNLWRLLVAILASFAHVCYLLYRGERSKGRRPRPVELLRFGALAFKHVVPAQVGVYLGSKSVSDKGWSPALSRRVHGFLSKGI
ncbi:MAG: glycosyltransferase family 2 protein [Rubrobacter sp.]